NAKLVDAINGDGTLYLTQTVHDGRYVIRVSVGTTGTTADDIDIVYKKIVELAESLQGI
ncbi:MAG: aspartate aminotransferase family protein, partial [Rhodospirillaceae bacterium]|nr:aspartate aminotransferase family protein [Rhodospirillaceae bacterium]